MEKIKRFFALLLIIVLLAMYISTLVFAIIDDPATMSLLKASIAATIIIPVFLWVIKMFAGINKRNSSRSSSPDPDDYTGSEETDGDNSDPEKSK